MAQKILIIEDNEAARKLLETRLKTVGYNVVCSFTGEEGIKLAETERPDLILLDIGLPHMDGYAVLSQIRNTPIIRSVPVIMITARTETKAVFTAKDLGSTDYVMKPFKFGELLEKIKKHVTPESGQYLDGKYLT